MNSRQQYAYDQIRNRRNVLLTAPAGCGKSYLIKRIYKDMSIDFNIGLTSTTGISANIIGGKTIHSFLGIGIGTDSVRKLYKKINTSPFLQNRWKRLNVLIIDEVSMLSVELFEKIEELARMVRQNEAPFGGIQIVLSGDFLQLPAVKSDKFCFESKIWPKCIDETILLTEVMRQTDQVFIRVLNKIRVGNFDDECKQVIGEREVACEVKDGILPTRLYSTNQIVDRANGRYYAALPDPEHEYKIEFKWHKSMPPRAKEDIESNINIPFTISLKIGAQVIYLVNESSDKNMFNGARGIVTGFIENCPKVLFTDGRTRIVSKKTLEVHQNDELIVSYTQIPLKLAWALTIHKSQGQTIDLVRVNLSRIFEYGQFYTALSRCRSLQNLYISNLDWSSIKAHPKALEFYAKLS